MYGKIFASMYDGTLGTKGPWQALVTFQQMIVLCDVTGTVDMTAEALSRRTSIPFDIISTGIAALEQPDPDSRSDAEQGRRIVRLDPRRAWGWRIVNYDTYRKLQTAEERRTYMREHMRDRRAAERAATDVVSSVVSNVSDCLETSSQSTHVDVDVEVEAEVKDSSTAIAGQGSRNGKSLPAVRGRATPEVVRERIALLFGEVNSKARTKLTAEQTLRAQAEMVFLYWSARFDHRSAVLDSKREARIIARLRENKGDVGELLYALDGAFHDDWTMGKAQNSVRKYDGVETILRDRSQVERFACTRKKFKEGKPHQMVEQLEAALRGDGVIHDGG